MVRFSKNWESYNEAQNFGIPCSDFLANNKSLRIYEVFLTRNYRCQTQCGTMNSRSKTLMTYFAHPLMKNGLITVEVEHAIQKDLIAYTRFYARNIFQDIAKKQVSK